MNTGVDVLIKNTSIVNGLGETAFAGDIGIKAGRIVRIGKIDAPANTVIDGSGQVTCPGFIDSHSHADLSILDDPGAENFIMQGITTVVGGHCGITVAPATDRDFSQAYMAAIGVEPHREWTTFDEWLRLVETTGPAVNYIPLVGLNALRGAVLGLDYRRAASPGEIGRIQGELERALDAGAFGLSASFDAGTAGHFADEQEVLALLHSVVRQKALFAPHTRHHQYQWPSDGTTETAYGLYVGPKAEILTGRYHGLLEILEYARQCEALRIMISHLSPLYNVPQPHPDYLEEAMAHATLEEIIDKPRAQGLEITFNALPSDHSIASELPMIKSFFTTSLARPEWLAQLDLPGFLTGLRFRTFREDLKAYVNSGRFKFGMLSPAVDPYWSDCYRIVRCANEAYVGKTVLELARKRSPHRITRALYDDAIEVVCDILQEDPGTTWALIRDKRCAGSWAPFLEHPFAMPCTDAVALPSDPVGKGRILDFGVPPNSYNTMPYYLVKMVRETRRLRLEEAIRKMTALPAAVLGVPDRGVLKEGNWADIVIMNWDALAAHDDFKEPHRRPEGIHSVIVNGRLAYSDGRFTMPRTGRVLRRNGR